MSKYIDLAETIHEDTRYALVEPALILIRSVLEWLDDHPDQGPERTVMSSWVVSKLKHKSGSYCDGFVDGLEAVGGCVIPDPEPTNAELIQEAVDEWEESGDRCSLADWLDRNGWTKAVGDDE